MEEGPTPVTGSTNPVSLSMRPVTGRFASAAR